MIELDILSRQEIRRLTGATWRSKQADWLRSRSWPHEIGDDGVPVVLRSVALERLGHRVNRPRWTMDDNTIK